MNSQSPQISHDDLREHLRARLKLLPQWPQIQPDNAERWIESVIENEAQRADWHVDRLMGFSGSEIGALSGASSGAFHPFYSLSQVVRSKLLLEPVTPPVADECRAMALEHQLRALYRARVAARGGHVCDALLAQVKLHSSSGQSWRVGSPPEIIKENGKLYLVDYQCPAESVETEYAIDGIPYYLKAQLHHYRALALEAGVEIDGMKLCSLDYRNWSVDERSIEFSNIIDEQVAQAGEFYWTEHVLLGIPADHVTINHANSLSDMGLDLPPGTLSVPVHDLTTRKDNGKALLVSTGEQELADASDLKNLILERAQRFLGWGFAESEAKSMREMLQQSLGEILPVSAVPFDVDRIETGHVRLRIDREFNDEAILTAALSLLEAKGYSTEEAKEFLNQPNFWHPAEFSSSELIDVLKNDFQLDVFNDPRFAAACIKEPARRLEPVLELIKEMDTDHTYRASDFVKGGRVRMEMPRSPLVGPLSELRTDVSGNIRRQLQDPLQAIADDFIVRRQNAEEQLLATKKTTKKRKVGGP